MNEHLAPLQCEASMLAIRIQELERKLTWIDQSGRAEVHAELVALKGALPVCKSLAHLGELIFKAVDREPRGLDGTLRRSNDGK